jgi:anti-anti-sigma factor
MKPIRTKLEKDVAVVSIRGMLMGDANTDLFRNTVKQLVENGTRKIILDFSKLSWINSHGVGALMACYASVSTAEGRIGLAGTKAKVSQVMTITKVHRLFDQYQSVKDAVRDFETP